MAGVPSFRQFQQQMKLIESVESGILQVAENEERRLDEKIRAIEEMGKMVYCMFFFFLFNHSYELFVR